MNLFLQSTEWRITPMELETFSRFYISYLLFNVGGWVYFGYLLNYTAARPCNSELTDPIKVLVGISMSATTLCLLATSKNINIHNADSFDDRSTNIYNMYCNIILVIIILSIASILGLTIFITTSGMTDIKCSDENAEFGLKLAVYGVIWIIMIEIALLLFYVVFPFISNVISNAKFHRLCSSCVDVFKRYNERRIGVINDGGDGSGGSGGVRPNRSSMVPKYNTFHITVPMPVKEYPRATCSVCYDNSISLLLEPCNHVCMCHVCYNTLETKKCPICKTPIETIRKIYFATPDN